MKKIEIHCSYTSLVPLDKIKPNRKNPNRHPEQQIALLSQNIQEMGWRHPIVVSKRSGLIVAGHARLRAAELLGLSEAPVDVQPFDSDEMELAMLVADNRLAELADIDKPSLKDLLVDLDSGAFNMDLTGFDVGALEKLLTAAPPPILDEPRYDPVDQGQGDGSPAKAGGGEGSATRGAAGQIGRVVECPNCHKEIML